LQRVSPGEPDAPSDRNAPLVVEFRSERALGRDETRHRQAHPN
jgi:hypothetical protein